MTEPRLIFLRVGQGDSIVLVGPEQGAVLVDLPSPQDVTAKLRDLEQPAIAAVFVTHAHRDHIASLIHLHRFLTDWRKLGTVHRVYLPDGMWGAAFERARRLLAANKDDREGKLIRAALDSLRSMIKAHQLLIAPVTVESGASDFGEFRVVPLHPHHVIVEEQKVSKVHAENALSLVLRIERGDFRALLLADADGVALSELDELPANELRAEVVKIPHHGGWPANPKPLESVLTKADPMAAVVSVGSCNRYGHVRAELFAFLLGLRQSGRLEQIRCTEVTRTCVHDAPARLAMKDSGLKVARPCAGEIQVVFPKAGGFEVRTETDHATVVANVEMAACMGKADLTP